MKIALMVLGIVIAATIVGGIAYVVTGPSDTVENVPEKLASPRSATQDNLQLVVAGFAHPFVNGDAVPVSGEVMAKIKVERGDERYSRLVDLYLFNGSTSQPVDDATVQVLGQMRFMDHATFRNVQLQSERGHYQLTLPFVMPGEWDVELNVIISGKPTKLRLQIEFYD